MTSKYIKTFSFSTFIVQKSHNVLVPLEPMHNLFQNLQCFWNQHQHMASGSYLIRYHVNAVSETAISSVIISVSSNSDDCTFFAIGEDTKISNGCARSIDLSSSQLNLYSIVWILPKWNSYFELSYYTSFQVLDHVWNFQSPVGILYQTSISSSTLHIIWSLFVPWLGKLQTYLCFLVNRRK